MDQEIPYPQCCSVNPLVNEGILFLQYTINGCGKGTIPESDTCHIIVFYMATPCHTIESVQL